MYAYLNDTNDSTSIVNSLPEVLRNAIIDTTAVSGHGSSDTTNFTTTDKLYLLSTHEVWEDDDGNTSIGIDYYDTAYNNTRQLDYYAGLNVTTSSYSAAIKKYKGSNNLLWLRSSDSSNVHSFCRVSSSGTWTRSSADFNSGVSPAFRLSDLK